MDRSPQSYYRQIVEAIRKVLGRAADIHIFGLGSRTSYRWFRTQGCHLHLNEETDLVWAHAITAQLFVAAPSAFSYVPALLRPFVTEQYDDLETITRVNEPVLLLHGTRDETIDPHMAERLEKACGANVIRINLTGGGHWVPLDSIVEKIWQQWEAAEAGKPAAAENAP